MTARRPRQVRRITVPHPPRRTPMTTPSICGDCMTPIDLEAVQRALRDGVEAVHTCGRVLARASVCDDCGHAIGPHRNRAGTPWCLEPGCGCRGWHP